MVSTWITANIYGWIMTTNSAKISDLENRISSLEKDMNLQKSQNRGQKKIDHSWNCTKCRSLLGIYDAKEKLIRIRYKDFVAYWNPGQSGYMEIICRSCSYRNRLSATDKFLMNRL